MYAKIFQSLLSPLLLMHTEVSILVCCQCDQVDIWCILFILSMDAIRIV